MVYYGQEKGNHEETIFIYLFLSSTGSKKNKTRRNKPDKLIKRNQGGLL